ncbi:MAG: hypothetical protein GC155_12630 [Alphaproteobacteria bacterium]|nr:hypothetical protein [Alphaproteobacteria bacterium]
MRHSYCGLPPDPSDLLIRWKIDPILITALVVIWAAYTLGVNRRATIPAWRQWCFHLGWLTTSLSLITPLCALSVSLFSARVGQHMIMSLIGAPLVMLGDPGAAFGALAPRTARALSQSSTVRSMRSPMGSALLFGLALWVWHSPAPYDATFHNWMIYWLMHLSVYGSALLVWGVMIDTRRETAFASIAVGTISTLQMTFLGALITLTPQMLYAPHAVTPLAWGMTQASDQQLGGLIMWVPGCTIFLAFTLVALGRLIADRPELENSR